MAALIFFSDETMVINVFCGVVSGVLSSSLANPTDVLKVSKIKSSSPLKPITTNVSINNPKRFNITVHKRFLFTLYIH